ncbi:MAG: hypothetical protein ACLR5T_01965 [Veillonella sp.]
MKRYCDACRHYCDEAAMFCPTCGQYTVATEVERIAPEGDVIYPFAHDQMSYKDTFLYVMGKKFMDTDDVLCGSFSFYCCGILLLSAC